MHNVKAAQTYLQSMSCCKVEWYSFALFWHQRLQSGNKGFTLAVHSNLLNVMQISDTVAGYAKLLPELTHSVKYVTPPHKTRDDLVAVWKEWMQEAGETAPELSLSLTSS